MADIIFPTHLKFWYDSSDQDIWVTTELRSYSGVRTSVVKYHMKEFRLPIGHLYDDDVVLLKGFINYVMGKHDSFYLVDPFHPVKGLTFTGDGGTTDFRLYRTYENLYTEYPVFPTGILGGYGYDGWICEELQGYGVAVQYEFDVYLNGVIQTSGYSLTTDGYLSFTTPPGSGVTILISEFYFCYLAHFKEDPTRTIYYYDGWKTDLVIETEP
jgi:hypothetical protein